MKIRPSATTAANRLCIPHGREDAAVKIIHDAIQTDVDDYAGEAVRRHSGDIMRALRIEVDNDVRPLWGKAIDAAHDATARIANLERQISRIDVWLEDCHRNDAGDIAADVGRGGLRTIIDHITSADLRREIAALNSKQENSQP